MNDEDYCDFLPNYYLLKEKYIPGPNQDRFRALTPKENMKLLQLYKKDLYDLITDERNPKHELYKYFKNETKQEKKDLISKINKLERKLKCNTKSTENSVLQEIEYMKEYYRRIEKKMNSNRFINETETKIAIENIEKYERLIAEEREKRKLQEAEEQEKLRLQKTKLPIKESNELRPKTFLRGFIQKFKTKKLDNNRKQKNNIRSIQSSTNTTYNSRSKLNIDNGIGNDIDNSISNKRNLNSEIDNGSYNRINNNKKNNSHNNTDSKNKPNIYN